MIFLIVCPATIMQHWLKEMHHFAPKIRSCVFHSISSTGKALNSLSKKGFVTFSSRFPSLSFFFFPFLFVSICLSVSLSYIALEQVFRTLRKGDSKGIDEGIAIITTYESLRRHKDLLTSIEWTAVCLDEGQKIRNYTTEITMIAKKLPTYHRILLSGTPIQNSLKELWCLFDFIYPGKLGNLQVFENEFATPIRLGGYINASKLQYEIGIRCAITLQRIISPYLLRRKKENLLTITQLPAKTEQILFCHISEKQRAIYHMILDSNEVKAVLSKRIPAFRAITTLRKLCNHPILVYQNNKIIWSENDDNNELLINLKRNKTKSSSFISSSSLSTPLISRDMLSDQVLKKLPKSSVYDLEDGEVFNTESEQENTVDMSDENHERSKKSNIPNRHRNYSSELEEVDNELEEERLINLIHKTESSTGISWIDSGKLLVLSKILPLWMKEKNKVLIFSQTVTMLLLIEDMLNEMNFLFLKLDGNTPIRKRNDMINTFNDMNSPYFIMLLTTRTGGVGISLTAANRVILFDPDWNPSKLICILLFVVYFYLHFLVSFVIQNSDRYTSKRKSLATWSKTRSYYLSFNYKRNN
jgi:SNF2 family DNA or RNA helicase